MTEKVHKLLEEKRLDCEVKLATVPRHAKFHVTEIRIETERLAQTRPAGM